MCGLFGLLDYNGSLNKHQITKIISVLAKESEVRGRDAGGIAHVHDDRLCVYKRPLPAGQKGFYLPKDSRVVMGHTRLTTKGSEKYNHNNHPFTGRAGDMSFALAHNGVLYNDTALRVRDSLPPTNIQTDSYVAVQLLEKHGTLDFVTLKNMAEKIEGSFSFTLLDEQSNLYLVKGDSPLCVYQFKKYGFYLYASTESILKKALFMLGFERLQYEPLAINCGDIVKITRDGVVTRSSFDTSHLYSDMFRYFDRPRGIPYHEFNIRRRPRRKTEYWEDIVNIAKSYGVTEEELDLLADFGYDEESIEDLLYSPSLFQRCVDEVLCDSEMK